MMFFSQCKDELKLSRKFLPWVDKEFKLFSSHKTASPTKELEEGTLKLTRERSSGRNIFDASQKTILKQPDGITTERVVKQTFANVTVREIYNLQFHISVLSLSLLANQQLTEEAKVSIVQSQIGIVKYNPRPQVEC